MLERMNNSIIQEKKAYALALQAQMNPHFLYNMLAVIETKTESPPHGTAASPTLVWITAAGSAA